MRKLEKLVYYSQAWHLVWEEKPLFLSRIEAWANGSVVPDLYNEHCGMFSICSNACIGDVSSVMEIEKESIDAVLSTYSKKSAMYLVLLTHSEEPWRKARKRAGVLPGERCNEEITLAEMAEYYSGLLDE